MVDLGEETREHFEDSDVGLHGSPNVGYYHTLPTPRNVLSNWRQNVQTQEQLSRPGLIESSGRPDFVQVKGDPENLSRICGSANGMPVFGTAEEDLRIRGQLLQDIARDFPDTFEPYNGSSVSTANYRSYSLSSEAQQATETDYLIPESTQWLWTRGISDDRSFVGAMGNNLMVGSGQMHDATLASLQYTVPMPDAFSSTLPSLTEPDGVSVIPASNSLIHREHQPSDLSPSALDLSPASPLQSSLIPQASHHMSTMPTPPVAHQLIPTQTSLGSQTPLTSLDVSLQHQPLSYHQNLEGSLELVSDVVNDDANPDDVVAYHQNDLKCNQCDVTFQHLDELRLHLKRGSCSMIQSEGNPQKEGKLPLLLPPTTAVEKAKRPQRTHTMQRSFSCKQCDETFSRAERLKVHELNHSGERPFKCNECSASFSAKTMLARHKKTHTGEKPYSCGQCKTSFTESGTLKIHMRLHTGDRPYKCDWCDEAFSGAGMLASHRRKHTGEKPYKCNECGASFRLLSTLKSHGRRHTGEKPFSCELCGSSFTQKAALRRHRRTHLNVKPHECEHCGFKFREKENLRRHRLIHKIKRPFVCDICGAGFGNGKKLENHRMLHNGGDKPFQCNKCPSSFVSSKYLTQHKKRVHDRKGSIRCEECNATFNRKETLRSHMRIHKGTGQYVCGQCGATFNQRAALTRHIRIHNNKDLVGTDPVKENNFCRMCDVVFKDRASMESHMMEHCVVEDFAYECPSCHLGFSDQLDLVKHKRIHHPAQRPASSAAADQDDDNNDPVKDKYVCEDCDQTFFRRRQLKAHKKYCPCKHLDDMEQQEDSKPTVALQNTDKEVSAMKLVSAVLAAAGTNTSDLDCQVSSSSELSSSIPFSSVASTTSSQHLHRYTTPQVSLSHDNLYEHQLQQIPQPVTFQESQQHSQHPLSLLHQTTNHVLLQSIQASLPQTSVESRIQDVERQTDMPEHTQETLPQTLREDPQLHHSFDFDISQQDFYKALPPQHLLSHHRLNHHDSSHDDQLLEGSVPQSIDQGLDECEDLHSSLHHNDGFLLDQREHFREEDRGQQRERHRVLHRSAEADRQEDHAVLLSQHENNYSNSFQEKVHSCFQYRLLKFEDKCIGETPQHGIHEEKHNSNSVQPQQCTFQDQTSLKSHNVCTKSISSYVSMQNKY